MGKRFAVEPDVSVSLGEKSRIDRSGDMVRVEHLHIKVEELEIDCITTTSPFFIFDAGTAQQIMSMGFTGLTFHQLEATWSEKIPDRLGADERLPEAPKLFWGDATQATAEDDFFKDPGRYGLVVSARALALLESRGLRHAIVTSYSD